VTYSQKTARSPNIVEGMLR